MGASRDFHIAALISSHRPVGNTEQLAELALEHVPVPCTVDRIRLFDYRIERFRDLRHAGVPLPAYDDDYESLLDRVLAADAILFAAPVYWYSLPGVLKDFLDRFSGSLRDPRRRFRETMRGKLAYVVTTVSDEDRAVAQPLVESLRLTAAYLQMAWGGYAVGYGNRPGDALNDPEGVAGARRLLANVPEWLAQRGN